LVEAHIAQIERVNPAVNAFVDLDLDRIRQQVRALERLKQPKGPMHGLPVTVKSSISTAGYLCEIGSTIHRGERPQQDAPVVARLRDAGAVILGTTNCPEFLMAYETDNLLRGRTNNPWNLEYSPGGSSGGESAAIAACMSAGGLGSDSGGSVRQPAHFAGICSLKPTPGRVPGRGHLPPCVGPFSTLGAIGPMARTIEDVRLLFRTLSGQDAIDPVGAPISHSEPALADLRNLTIGYFEDDGLVPVTRETRMAIQSAAEALRDAGFRVEHYRPRSLEPLRKLWWTFFVQCGAMFYEPTIRGKHDQLSPIFREFLGIAQASGELNAVELLNSWAEMDLLRSKLLEEMESYPFLLCPVASVPAFRHGERSWLIDGQRVAYLDAMRHTQWFNVLATPAAVVPVGLSPEGLPIGVQLVGLPYRDEAVLAIASVIDEAFGYRVPDLAKG
jgi:amidase